MYTPRALSFLGALALMLSAGASFAQTVTLDGANVVYCRPVNATVSLPAPAPSGGATFFVTSSLPAVAAPPSVTVPEGATSTTFGLTTSAIDSQQTGKISILDDVGNVLSQASLKIRPAIPSRITVSANPMQHTTSQAVTVNLICPAGPSGVTATLSTTNESVAWFVEDSVSFAPGESSQPATVESSAVASATVVNIQALANGVSNTSTIALTVKPPTAKLLDYSYFKPVGTSSVDGIVTLDFTPVHDVTVDVWSDDSSLARPAVDSFVIPAGSAAGTFVIDTAAVEDDLNSTPTGDWREVFFHATAEGVTRSRMLTVRPNSPGTMDLEVDAGGTPVVMSRCNTDVDMTIVMRVPSPFTTGSVVRFSKTLQHANNDFVTVPASVTVPFGDDTIVVPLVRASTASNGPGQNPSTATITAEAGGITRTVELTHERRTGPCP